MVEYLEIREGWKMGDYFMLVLVEKDIVGEKLEEVGLIWNGLEKGIRVREFGVGEDRMYLRIKGGRWVEKCRGKR